MDPKRTEAVEAFYEISLAIGTSLDLGPMLKHALSTIMRRLHCSFGRIYVTEPTTEGGLDYNPAVSIPRRASRFPGQEQIESRFPRNAAPEEVADYRSHLPIIGPAGDYHSHLIDLDGRGLLLILRHGEPLDDFIMESLPPLAAKLGGAISACLQNRALEATLEKIQRVQQDLIDSEAVTRGIVDTAVDGVITIDENGVIQSFNAAAERIFGYEAAEMIGQPITMLMPEPHHSRHAEYMKRYLEGGPPRVIGLGREVTGLRSDGRNVPLELAVGEVVLEGRRLFTGFLRDITQRKQAEDEIRRLSLVATQTDNIVIITDENARIQWVNSAFHRLTGYSSEKVQGKSPGDLLQGPDTDPRVIDHMHKRLSVGEGFNVEVANYDSWGRKYWVEIEARPIHDDEGNLTNFVAIERNVTERKRAEEELGRARNEAEAANQAKSDFLASMSHEIRTPLNAIIGMADLLEETRLNEEQSKFVRVFRAAGEHLLIIINDILDLSKIEAGRIELEKKPFNPAHVMENLKETFGPSAREKGLDLSLTVDEDVPAMLLGDPVRLAQVLTNLVGNAIKFTDAGNVRVHIRPFAPIPQDAPEAGLPVTLLFQVEDTGIGIPLDRIEDVFERFTQVESANRRRHGGTGLGLAISRNLVKLMGGRIWADSRPGEGSRFSFTALFEPAPDREAAGPGASPPTAEFQPQAATSAARPMDILVVEDNEDNRLLINNYFKKTPHRITLAFDGGEAVDKFTAGRFDLVFMDVRMPVMDGYEATARIRELEEREGRGRTPVVALTAHAMQEDIEQSLAAGCDEHMSKPIKKKTLLDLVARYAARAEEQHDRK